MGNGASTESSAASGVVDTTAPGPRGSKENVGSVTIEAQSKCVLEALMDHPRKTEYEGGLELAEEVAGSAKGSVAGYPAEWVEYKRYHIIPGMSKRDYAFQGTLKAGKDADGKATITLAVTNIELPDKPAGVTPKLASPKFTPATVRGYVVCTYTLTELAPKTTQVEIHCNLDPMGLFPMWLTTLYGGAYPGMMLKRVAAQSLKVAKEKEAAS